MIMGTAAAMLEGLNKALLTKAEIIDVLNRAAALYAWEVGEWSDDIIVRIAGYAGVRLQERYPNVRKAIKLSLNESCRKDTLAKYRAAGWVKMFSMYDGRGTSEHFLVSYLDNPEPI